MPEKNQKQISSKYQGDIITYRKVHPLRSTRFVLSTIAFLGALVWALGFKNLGGTAQFFNTGPISQNHHRFENDCSACHIGADTDLMSILPIDAAKKSLIDRKTPLMDTLRETGDRALVLAKENLTDPDKLASSLNAALGALNLDNIDRACLVCHDGMSLHQPGTKAVMFRDTVKAMAVVGAGACSVCHQEHMGPGRMKLPTQETCVACHGDETTLKKSLLAAKFDGKLAKAHSQNMKRGDLIQWVPPAREHSEPKIVKGFSDSDPARAHPAFLYEQPDAKDRANILFNHARHIGPIDAKTGARTQAKGINTLNGEVLDCRTCHKPAPDGVGMQKVQYAQHCQACHTMGVDPKLPELTVPHRDPEKVRAFLVSLRAQWMDLAKARYNISDATTLDAFWRQREAEFLQDWPQGKTPLETFDLWQERVFFTGIPPREQAPNGQRLPACNKCHTVEKGVPVPKVAPTLIPDEWLTRGPFKHNAHMHMNCTDCHRAVDDRSDAEKNSADPHAAQMKAVLTGNAPLTGSKSTEDILLPSQKLCAECHRPRDYDKVVFNPTQKLAPTFGEFNSAAATKQRREGGVFDDCLRCHKYHVPAAEMDIARALRQKTAQQPPPAPAPTR